MLFKTECTQNHSCRLKIKFYKNSHNLPTRVRTVKKKKEKKENNHSLRGQTTPGLKQFGHVGLNLILRKLNSTRWIIQTCIPTEKRDKRYQISSQLDTIFPTVDISIFVESESEHPG